MVQVRSRPASGGTGGAGNLSELSDVSITSVEDNDLLAYNSSTSEWTNQSVSEVGLDSIYLKLDQSTPQTVSNGIPLLDTTPNGNADIKSFVNKEYVDLAVTSLGAVYYMHDEDDATGYKTCYLEPSSDAEAYLEKADLSDDDYIAGWISATGEAPSKLLKGVYDWFITLEKTTGTKDLRVYWELIERKSDNSEVVIATSSNSNLITDKESYLVPLQLDNDYIPDTNSRIVGKLYADVSGSGNAPTVRLYYQGDTSSRWEIPANSEVFKNIFVPYSGAVKNVDLGDKNLTTTGNINGGNLNIANWDTAYSWGDHSTAGYFVKATDTTDDITEGTTNKFYSDEKVDDRVADLIQDGTGISWTYDDTSNTLTGNVSLASFDTDNLSEGSSNLYWTQTRFNSAFSNKTTDDLSEGSTNLYYTDAKFDTRFATKTTDNLSEGSSNLYYTDARVGNYGDSNYLKLDGSNANSDIDISPYNITAGNLNISDWNTAYSWGDHSIEGYLKDITNESIGDLSDVDLTDIADGKILKYNSTTGNWECETESGGATQLSDLSDVNTSTPTAGNVLRADGVDWESTTLSHSDLSGVNSDDHHTRYALTEDLSSNEISQLQNIDSVTISNTQWGYLGAMTGQPLEDLSGQTTDDLAEGTTNKYYSDELVDDRVANLIQDGTGISWTYDDNANTLTANVSLTSFDTDDLSEGSSNLYWTQTKFDTAFSEKTTDDLSEGTTNKYYTDEKVDDRVSNLIQDGSNISWTYNDTANTLTGNVSSTPTFTSATIGDLTLSSNEISSSTDTIQIGKNLELGSNSLSADGASFGGIVTMEGTFISSLSYVLRFVNNDGGSADLSLVGNYLQMSGGDGLIGSGDLGSSDNKWTNLYLSGSASIDTLSISSGSISDSSGEISFETNDISTTGSGSFGSLMIDSLSGVLKASAGSVSGSATTDDLPQGSSNKYYSDALVDAHLSGGTGISYSSGTISLSHLGFESLTDPDADRIPFWDDSQGTFDWKDFSNWDTAYSWGNHADAGYFVKGTDSIDEANDVDTTTDTPQKNEVLKWNGSKWVPAPYNYNFTFSIASFSDGESTIQLIGSGVWRSSGAMSYSASYNNGPPTSATVKMSINGGSYNTVGSMNSPDYETGTNSQNINYPTSKDQYLRFRLDASDGTDNDTQYESSIYFRNYLYWGVSSKNSGFTESDIEALSGKQLTNDHTQSKTISAGSGKYLVWACPANYTDLPTGTDYETNGGGTGFVFKGMTCAFQTKETVSVTNSAGYTENYEVYASTLPNLGYGTLTTYTSRQAINKIYYGTTTKTSGYTESDVENLEKSEITNDSTQIWDSLTAGSGEYLLFAFPKRWGIKGTDYSFYDYSTGFEASFLNPETVSITNSNGWTEDFYVYRSENANLGTITIQTK